MTAPSPARPATDLAEAPRRRGRPLGATSRLVQRTALGLHHFAFLRSYYLRLPLESAWARYMAFTSPSSDARFIERRRAELLKQVLFEAHRLNLTLPPAQRLDRQLALLAQAPYEAPAGVLPTLEEFRLAEDLPEDLSERELMALYQEHYPTDGAAESPGRDRGGQAQVQALADVERLVSRPLQASDPLALWLTPGLAAALREHGVMSLGELVQLITVGGYHWYKPVARLGRARAVALAQWLAPLAEQLGRALPAQALTPPRTRALDRTRGALPVANLGRFGLASLETVEVPPALRGGPLHGGVFCTGQPNHLDAQDDLGAVRAWLAMFADSPATQRAYRKEAERFYLWALHVCHKPLSALTSVDCRAYLSFLRDLPPSWIEREAVSRLDPRWRPFRGALSVSSQRYALSVISAMFDALVKANYLVGNPVSAVMASASLERGKASDRLERSFTNREWRFLLEQLEHEGQAPGRQSVRARAEWQRLRLALELLVSTGLRVAEVTSVTLADLVQVEIDGEEDLAWVLNVMGKGRRRREVAVAPDVVALIREHHALAAQLGALPSPAPLLLRLALPPEEAAAWARPESGDRPAAGAPAVGPGPASGEPPLAALTAIGLYRQLKRFFMRAAQEAFSVDGVSAQRIRAASTHWLRHTFGRQGAAAGVPVEVLQQVFGHASLSTTTVYVSTERARMVKALRGAWHRNAAR